MCFEYLRKSTENKYIEKYNILEKKIGKHTIYILDYVIMNVNVMEKNIQTWPKFWTIVTFHL